MGLIELINKVKNGISNNNNNQNKLMRNIYTSYATYVQGGRHEQGILAQLSA